MIKKYEKIKIRVEHFPYFTKTKRTLGNCTKIMISVKNEITLKSRSSKGGAPGESQARYHHANINFEQAKKLCLDTQLQQ